MSRVPELTVIVSTFERPDHLQRCLLSLERQQLAPYEYEIIVSDDGSRDHTAALVAEFARHSRVACKFVTQQHQGFQKSKAINAALRKAAASYLLLTDGDCIFPPDHLQQHLAARQPGVVQAGDSIRLSEVESQKIDRAATASGQWLDHVPKRLDWSLRKSHWKALAYSTLGHSFKPKIVGNNVGVWRRQLESINGFDETFTGWGCEDDDIGQRLRANGQRVKSILGRTHGYHLWHAPDPSTPTNWKDGVNVDYFLRPTKLTRCLNGIQSIDCSQLSAHVIFGQPHSSVAKRLESRFQSTHCGDSATVCTDLEILFWSGQQKFTGQANPKVLISDGQSAVPKSIRRKAGCQLVLNPNNHGSHIQHQGDAGETSHQVNWLFGEIACLLGANIPNESQPVCQDKYRSAPSSFTECPDDIPTSASRLDEIVSNRLKNTPAA